MKRLLITAVLIIGLIGGSALAEYQNTASGVTINSLGTSVTLSYKVGSAPTRNTNSAVSASAVVLKNGGIKQTASTWTDLPATNNIDAGTGYSYTFTVVNSGNFTEAVAAGIVSTTGGFAGTWLSSLNTSNIVISREGQYTGGTLYVTADASAEDGDIGGLTVSINGTTSGAFYKQYTGANSYTYGASGNVQTALTFQVRAPKIYVTKNVTVQAPASYVSAGGAATDPVPGATLVYTLTYYNYGSVAGNSVEIVDTIPGNTAYSSAAGGSAQTCYNASGTVIASPATPVDDTVASVKWTIGTVSGSSGGTVTLNAVIK